MNASICFGNAKKFLLEVKRLEQVNEMEREKTGGSWVVDSGMQLADQQAANAMAALLKVRKCTLFDTFSLFCSFLFFLSPSTSLFFFINYICLFVLYSIFFIFHFFLTPFSDAYVKMNLIYLICI
jgi:hypothetical protein